MDLTTLNGGDTDAVVEAVCEQAMAAGVAAVCVYPVFIATAKRRLAGSGIPVASVAAGFPHGLSPLPIRVAEVAAVVEAGADEVDFVIRRSHALTGRWAELFDEVRQFRRAAGEAVLKAILATGELRNTEMIYRAALTCLMAGADFVKTSTGKETVNATLDAGVAMAQAIRTYHVRTGLRTGLKPAGGIRTAEDAIQWLALVREELGAEWLTSAHFRIGASSLLTDVQNRLMK